MIRFALAAGMLSVTAPAAAGPPRYHLTDLGALPGGGTASAARAISDNGLVVGEQFDSATGYNRLVRLDAPAAYLPTLAGGLDTVSRGINRAGVAAATVAGTATDNDRAALISRTGATQLAGVAGYAAAGAFDVNDRGVATGYVLSSGRDGVEGSVPITQNLRPENAVVWSDGVSTLLSNGGGAIANSVGYAINAAGQVAGLARLPGDAVRAVRWSSDGALTILSIGAGQTMSVARAINDRGDVAGLTSQGSGVNSEGAVWTGSQRFDLALDPALGAVFTRGINHRDTVVGFAQRFAPDGDAVATGELWQRTASGFADFALDTLVVNLDGWQTSAPQSINDRGDIVGLGVAPDGSGRAYLLTPVPEPAGWAMMIAGFGLTGIVRRRASRSPRAAPAL